MSRFANKGLDWCWFRNQKLTHAAKGGIEVRPDHIGIITGENRVL